MFDVEAVLHFCRLAAHRFARLVGKLLIISPQGCIKSRGMSCMECLLLSFTIAASCGICPKGCPDMAGLTLCIAQVAVLQGHFT